MPPETTVLVVEREPQVRRLLREILVRAGLRVLETRGGEAALHFCTTYSGPIDVLVTDDQYLELVEIARRRPGLRFIAFSGAPAAAFPCAMLTLTKPFTPEALLGAIRSLRPPERSASQAT